MPDPEILTTDQAVHRFGVTPSELSRWCRDGNLTRIRTSRGHRRWLAADIRQELARLDRREDRTCQRPGSA